MELPLFDDFKNFLKIALKDYRRVAAFYPTPKRVVQKILSKISLENKYFIEYGAGSGAFTREILKRLPADGKLLAIETNQDFIEQLKRINDPRLILFSCDVREMPQNLNQFGLPSADIIISSIPFSQIAKKEREVIVKNSWQLLSENGIFIAAYQNIPLILPVLKQYFKKVSWYLDPYAIAVPYFVIFAEKK